MDAYNVSRKKCSSVVVKPSTMYVCVIIKIRADSVDNKYPQL